MGSIHQTIKLKLKCPRCDKSLFGLSFFDDYNQEEHTTICKNCGFMETYDETQKRIGNK